MLELVALLGIIGAMTTVAIGLPNFEPAVTRLERQVVVGRPHGRREPLPEIPHVE